MSHHNSERSENISFSKEVTCRHGGETLTACYQCGTCASSCPVARLDSRFNPREVIKLALLGEKDELISGESIWLCTSCFNCQERCPQNVEIAELIYALRNIAIEAGNSPNIYADFGSALLAEGRIVQISKFVEKKREEYGLPPLKQVNLQALNKILDATGFTKPEKREASQ
ncbi:4Fe-4S dicluster domain-containing protein [Candidatus Bathyarchaeota archaeon]|nr:4Fe-4S dicluster domain-containing protein [Candidatus Bathyarchaeota archaeon]